MSDTIDLLQIKIEKAKALLPEDAQNAINAVDWKAVILNVRETKGYSFEQLGDLEIETELVLCGLLNPEDYPKELEKRMHLSKIEVDDLVKEMNDRVFAKIKENLIKNMERKEVFIQENPTENPAPEKPVLTEKVNPVNPELIIPPSILAQKLSDSIQIPVVKTEHSLENITKTAPLSTTPPPAAYPPRADPYRLSPDE